MKGKKLCLTAMIAIAVAMALVIPVYAYTTSVTVDDNSISSTVLSIDIEEQTEPFSVTPPTFENVTTPVWVRNHTFGLVADDDVEMRAWLYLDEPSDWLILDHAQLIVYCEADQTECEDTEIQKYIQDALDDYTFKTVAQSVVDSTPGTYYVKSYDVDFGEEEDGVSAGLYWSFVPTESMTLDPDRTYKFDLAFHFKGLVGNVLYDDFAEDFTGSITFAIAGNDPVPTT